MRPQGSVSIARRVIQAPVPAPGRLVICRHASTALNRGSSEGGERIRGWLDIPLDAEGKKEARAIGALFAGSAVDLIVTSDLVRAKVTAQAIRSVTKAPLVETKSLRPWNLGDFQGQPSADVIPRVHREYVRKDPGAKVPGGESFNEFRARFLALLQEALGKLAERPGMTIVFVTSYRPLKVVEAWIAAGGHGQRLSLSVFFEDSLRPGAIYEVVPGDGGATGRLLSPGFQDSEPAGKTPAS